MRRVGVLLIAAVLTALAGLVSLAGRVALERNDAWRSRFAGEMTVAIRPGDPSLSEPAARRAAEVLAGTPGVAEARALDPSRVAQILSPWTAGARGPDLSVLPRLIAVELDPLRPAGRQDLADALSAAGIDGIVDDHKGWRQGAEDVRQNLLAGSLVGLLLCAAGLFAISFLAVDQEMAKRQTALRIRLQLGETPFTCAIRLARPVTLDLLIGVATGVLAAVGLAWAVGLAPVDLDPVQMATAALWSSGLAGGAGAIVLACTLAAAARRIREMKA